MRAIVCDKCDKILPLDGDYRILVPTVDDSLPAWNGESLTHLCLDCFEDFKRWVERREEPVACGDPE